MADSLVSRQRALREWAAANRDTPLGRITGRILAEDDASDYLAPEYYAGLAFTLEAVMDEVL